MDRARAQSRALANLIGACLLLFSLCLLSYIFLTAMGGQRSQAKAPVKTEYARLQGEIDQLAKAYRERPMRGYDRILADGFKRIKERLVALKPAYPQLANFPQEAKEGRLWLSYSLGEMKFDAAKAPFLPYKGPTVFRPESAMRLYLSLRWEADPMRQRAKVQPLRDRQSEAKQEHMRQTGVFTTINRKLDEPASSGFDYPIIKNEATINLRYTANPNLESSLALEKKIDAIIEEEAARMRPLLEPFVEPYGTPSLKGSQ